MRKLLLSLSIGTILGLTACDKSTTYESEGTITGFDLAMCACCGGYFIEIDGEQYRFYEENLPNNHQLDLNALPVDVQLNWDEPTNECTRIIEITEIEER